MSEGCWACRLGTCWLIWDSCRNCGWLADRPHMYLWELGKGEALGLACVGLLGKHELARVGNL